MGYHRLHTHRSYSTPKVIEYFFAVCGTLTLQGGPIFWTAVHRIHHQNSDHDGDPHTPRDGRWWAHMLWTLFGEPMNADTAAMGKYAPDMMNDRFYRVLSQWHWVPLVVLGLALLAVGGLPWVLWGVFFRVVFGLHCTWLVNSATHLWGTRQFPTNDDSRNSWWVALLTFGEGWHNNHHAHPTSARHGLHWYQVDSGLDSDQASREDWSRVGCQDANWRPNRTEDRRRRTGSIDALPPSPHDRPRRRYSSGMAPTGVRGRKVALVSILGAVLIAVAVALNIGWIVVNWRTGLLLLAGIISFAVLIAGLALNTAFLIREIRRTEQHNTFIHAVTHELKTPLASITLHLQTLRQRSVDTAKQQEFIETMLADTVRLQSTIDQVLPGGKDGQHEACRERDGCGPVGCRGRVHGRGWQAASSDQRRAAAGRPSTPG